MADDRVCQGYHVIRRKHIWDAEVVLAHNPSVESTPYATWMSYAHTQFQSFVLGHYFTSKTDAEDDFYRRIVAVKEEYGFLPKSRKPPRHDDRER